MADHPDWILTLVRPGPRGRHAADAGELHPLRRLRRDIRPAEQCRHPVAPMIGVTESRPPARRTQYRTAYLYGCAVNQIGAWLSQADVARKPQ
jgi:hypothetical protein